jgi:hypothetical protein
LLFVTQISRIIFVNVSKSSYPERVLLNRVPCLTIRGLVTDVCYTDVV